MERFWLSSAGGRCQRDAVTRDLFCEQMDASGESELPLRQDTFTMEMKFLKLLNLLWDIHV